MSRGRGRVERLILESVKATRYGCTVQQLAYQAYGLGRGDAPPTEAQLDAVRRGVDRLVAEELVVERIVFGHDRYILPATAPLPRPKRLPAAANASAVRQQTLQCLACDLQWVSEERAAHPLCWSCGAPGRPARGRAAHPARS